MPFPAEHPFTSHISQFSVFPETCKTNTGLNLREPTPLVIGTKECSTQSQENESVNKAEAKEVGTQTDRDEGEDKDSHTKQNPYYISDKSYCHAARKEIYNVDLQALSDKDDSYLLASLRPGIYRWDVSRSRSLGHQVIIIAGSWLLCLLSVAFYDLPSTNYYVLT